jgi:hypothetical protein
VRKIDSRRRQVDLDPDPNWFNNKMDYINGLE